MIFLAAIAAAAVCLLAAAQFLIATRSYHADGITDRVKEWTEQ